MHKNLSKPLGNEGFSKAVAISRPIPPDGMVIFVIDRLQKLFAKNFSGHVSGNIDCQFNATRCVGRSTDQQGFWHRIVGSSYHNVKFDWLTDRLKGGARILQSGSQQILKESQLAARVQKMEYPSHCYSQLQHKKAPFFRLQKV